MPRTTITYDNCYSFGVNRFYQIEPVIRYASVDVLSATYRRVTNILFVLFCFHSAALLTATFRFYIMHLHALQSRLRQIMFLVAKWEDICQVTFLLIDPLTKPTNITVCELKTGLK